MIKKITNSNMNEIMEVLKKEPAFNLFAIGDIEVYGCDGETVEVWSQEENDEIVGVLLRYNSSFVFYYTNDTADTSEFLNIVKNHEVEPDVVSGKGTVMDRIEKEIEYKEYKKMYFCRMDRDIDQSEVIESDVFIAVPEDAQKICALQNTIDEFSVKAVPERVAKNIESGFARAYCIKNETGDIVSMAQTSAENSVSAMIVGVCTHKDYRKRGYMRRVMTKLCYDLQQEDKMTCLFYDNKDAGRIYHSIGFETIGMWNMLVLRDRK